MTTALDSPTSWRTPPAAPLHRLAIHAIARAGRASASLCAILTVVACAGIPTAQMDLPAELSGAQALALPVPGTRSGRFDLSEALGGGSVRFERSADRWSFFDTVAFDRAMLNVRWQSGSTVAREQQCWLRRTALHAAGGAVEVQPVRLTCDGDGTRLELQAKHGARQIGRTGNVTSGAQKLEIRSAHRIQGTPLSQDEPVGYVLLEEGRPVAALDLLNVRPTLHLGPSAPALRQTVVEAALLLALSWGPAR